MKRFAVVVSILFLCIGIQTYFPDKTIAAPEQQPTLKSFLQTAIEPVGSTMYIWGGGWNEEDTAAGPDALRIGVSPKWKRFADRQTASYDYHKHQYKLGYGLDCSGYVGWTVYNTVQHPSAKGYVTNAGKQGAFLAKQGFGTYKHKNKVKNYCAGDIMSSECSCCGHVWIVIGECKDGSVVMVHSSPPGVRLCGTVNKKGSSKSQAVRLAKKYMKKYYKDWYDRYPSCLKGDSYLSHYGQMRWNLDGSVMSDPDGYHHRNAKEILKDLYR